MSVLDDLSEDQKRELVSRALVAARELGYCDEAINVVSAMGLPEPEWQEKEIIVKVNIMVSPTTTFSDIEDYYFEISSEYPDDVTVESWERVES